MAHGLTPKQERFCIEFFRCGNASEAYRIAYDAENMTAGSIGVRAHELLDNSKITVRLDELKKEVAKKVIITKEMVIERLAEIGMQDDRDRVSAYSQICKILGFEAPKSSKITVETSSPWEKFCEEQDKGSENGD